MIPDSLKDAPVAVALDQHFGAAVQGGHNDRHEPTIFVAPASILEVCRFLKEEQAFIRLSAITAVDWYPADPRFEVIYLLHSIARNLRFRVKCRVGENDDKIAADLPFRASLSRVQCQLFTHRPTKRGAQRCGQHPCMPLMA